MLCGFYTSRFSPESFEFGFPDSDSYRDESNWQVFWLKVYFNAFPSKTVAKIETSHVESFYSYGDSSGIEPDSHFNSPPEAEKPITPQM